MFSGADGKVSSDAEAPFFVALENFLTVEYRCGEDAQLFALEHAPAFASSGGVDVEQASSGASRVEELWATVCVCVSCVCRCVWRLEHAPAFAASRVDVEQGGLHLCGMPSCVMMARARLLCCVVPPPTSTAGFQCLVGLSVSLPLCSQPDLAVCTPHPCSVACVFPCLLY